MPVSMLPVHEEKWPSHLPAIGKGMPRDKPRSTKQNAGEVSARRRAARKKWREYSRWYTPLWIQRNPPAPPEVRRRIYLEETGRMENA